MDKGPAGDWDDLGVWPDCVYFDGSTYHMWFGGYDGTYSRIGYATSPDRITWTKYDDPSTTNPPFTQSDPVLIPDAGEWDQHSVGAPCVFFDGIEPQPVFLS